MNRHERRASAARGQQLSGARPPGLRNEPAARAGAETPGAPEQAAPAKPSWVLRLVARVLLSRWVLARVKNPDVERLLISVAMEAGRPEIATELRRRQPPLAR